MAALAAAVAAGAQAQELTGYAGALRVDETRETTFTGVVSYSQSVNQHVAASLMYQNEGHPDDHHRDGVGAQAWLRSGYNQPGWSFAAGVGAYYYFDTTELHSAGPAKYTNDHGWAPIGSLQATYHLPDSRWYGQAMLNYIAPTGGKNATTSLLLGVGYQFDGIRGDKLHIDDANIDQAVTVMAGQGITNSLDSERSPISAIEYRRAVGRYVDWTVTAINEGDSPQSKRNGVATQLWLIRSITPKTEIGMGAGMYFNGKVPDGEGQRSHKAGLVSIGGRYHITRRIAAQALWNRVISDYHRDADLFLLGVGYSF